MKKKKKKALNEIKVILKGTKFNWGNFDVWYGNEKENGKDVFNSFGPYLWKGNILVFIFF